MQPTYTIFAGVNGSGKSTLYNMPYIPHDNLGVRINSDEILVANGGDWRNTKDQAEAMKEAVRLIKDCIKRGISFNQETTLSGRSIINSILNAKKSGFKIKLHYVGLESSKLAIQRVADRVSKGGHGIPKEDIERRYNTSLSNLKEVMPLIDNLYIYDNSTYMNLQNVAQLDGSNIISINHDCDWIKNIIVDTIIPLDERKDIENMITKYGFKPNDSLVVDFYRLNQLTESKNTVKDVKERFFKEKFFYISNDKINDIVNQISNNFITQEKTKSKVTIQPEDSPDPE